GPAPAGQGDARADARRRGARGVRPLRTDVHRRRCRPGRTGHHRAGGGAGGGRAVLRRAAEPGRGLPRPHRPARGQRRSARPAVRDPGPGGGRSMTTTATQQGAAACQPEDARIESEDIGAVLVGRPRPARPSALQTSLTFGWRALLKIKHVPEQLFDVTAFPVMMTLMFTYLFGGAIAGSVNDYVQFL